MVIRHLGRWHNSFPYSHTNEMTQCTGELEATEGLGVLGRNHVCLHDSKETFYAHLDLISGTVEATYNIANSNKGIGFLLHSVFFSSFFYLSHAKMPHLSEPECLCQEMITRKPFSISILEICLDCQPIRNQEKALNRRCLHDGRMFLGPRVCQHICTCVLLWLQQKVTAQELLNTERPSEVSRFIWVVQRAQIALWIYTMQFSKEHCQRTSIERTLSVNQAKNGVENVITVQSSQLEFIEEA